MRACRCLRPVYLGVCVSVRVSQTGLGRSVGACARKGVHFGVELYMCMCVYVYMCVYMCVYVYAYMHLRSHVKHFISVLSD